jgi:hypothetical protein
MSDTIEQDEHLRRMMRQAFDDAFKLQIGLLYKTYLANISSVGDKQRQYTAKGIENAAAAYRVALSAIEEWEG